MHRISGRAVRRESRTGIAGLLATLYERNATPSTPVRPGAPEQPDENDLPLWNRLGAVATTNDGSFTVPYEPTNAIPGERARRLDLMVVLTAPDQSCTPRPDVTSRVATCVREGAGRKEKFHIVVDDARLQAAGVTTRDGERDVDDLIARRRAATDRRERLDAESRRVLAARITRRRDLERRVDGQFDTFLSALSGVSPQRRLSGRYVPRGASVLAANEMSIRDGIARRINPASAAGMVALTAEQSAPFRGPNGNLLASIPSSALEGLLRPKIRGPSLVRTPILSRLCRKPSTTGCLGMLQVSGDGDAIVPPVVPTPVPDANGAPPPPADVPLLVAKLMEHLTPPESEVLFGIDQRAGLAGVQEGVNGFLLHSGPADAPALHDFHQVRIAFEHVWQELFDENVVDKGKRLYAHLVELGIDPNEYLVDPSDVRIRFNNAAGSESKSASENEMLRDMLGALTSPPMSVVVEFEITDAVWNVLRSTPEDETSLEDIAKAIGDLRAARDAEISALSIWAQSLPAGFVPADLLHAITQSIRTRYDPTMRDARRQGERMIRYAENRLKAPQQFDQFHELLGELESAMKEPHRFSIYAANRLQRSVNFGLVATYRQRWEPVSYQVGELVKTIPLAPKEVRRFTKRNSVRRSRAEKEVLNHLQVRRNESEDTARAETEIIARASARTNFQLTSKGGVDVGIANASGSTSLAQDAASESHETKRDFREAVVRAAQEYKSERMMEIEVLASSESVDGESGEIGNPNDEIAVTYLFYQLQRRYRVSETIHRLTPIVLVAQEFPTPSEIDEEWIIRHDWILRRVILDDSFIAPMDYITGKVIGDEVSLRELYQNLQQQRRIADQLAAQITETRQQSDRRYAALQRSVERRANLLDAEEGEGFLQDGVEGLFGGGGASPEAARVREDAARDAFERASKQEKELTATLERESTALGALTERYTTTLSEHLNRKAAIARLRVHIKSNIMYYMQAIWSHEPPDQRFFRLHETRVPKLQGTKTYTLQEDPDAIPEPPNWIKPFKVVAKVELDGDLEFETLEQVADLDNLLGFKGNYMMFPLRKSNDLTDFMSIPYFDAESGIRDPDPLGNWTLADFAEYVCCLHKTRSPEAFTRLRPGLEEAYRKILNTPGSGGEEIIVPTDSLFIEALPGAHPILEDYRLLDRAADSKKAQAQVRVIELENVRLAARLLAGERDDPSVDRKVVIEHNGAGAVA